jgi:hypothetical protein
MPTSIRWALPTLQLLKLFLKTDSKRIPDDLAVGLIRFSTLHLGFDLNNA